MQSPYVIFDRRARHMMRKHYKTAPDLRVRVSTNSLGAADHVVTYSANYRLRTKVVHGLKFEVYEMMPHPEIQSAHLPDFEQLELQAIDEGKTSEPYLCIHAKTYVFDRRISYIGTMNLDPRSFYYNGECGVFIDDESFAAGLRDTLLYEMSARNSWVIARVEHPLSFANRIMEFISTALPIDPWPLRSTSGFELKPGGTEVGPFHPDFHENYLDIGSFPGTQGLDSRRLWTSFLKTFGKGTTPLL
jgi:phosphatidylserine/phosphatidylglycerophosphate/cardiolipin synthase-like enzyme